MTPNVNPNHKLTLNVPVRNNLGPTNHNPNPKTNLDHNPITLTETIAKLENGLR